MARRRVMSAEEIRARMELRATGGNPDSAQEVLSLRGQLERATAELQRLRDAPKKFSPAELRKDLDGILERYGVEPAEELIKIALAVDDGGVPLLGAGDRAAIWEGLMQYRMPKLRAVEHSGSVNQNVNIIVMRFDTKEVVEKRPMVLDTTVEGIDP